MTPQKTLDEYMRKEIPSKTNQQPTPQYKTIEFYRETEFQETEIGKVPKDWRIVELAHLARIIMGQSPPSNTYNREGIGTPFLQGKMEFGRIYPSPVMYTTQPLKIAEPNDVLISVRAPVGDVNIAPCRLCIGRGLAAIRFNPEIADYMFYFYYFQLIKERLEALGKGSTFKAITKKDLEKLKVAQPPVNEQKKIAEILSTIDKAIEGVDESVARLERLKRALMRELLTGRVRVKEENDKLTFYRETEFQETEIGKIPREWRLHRLVELFSYVKGKKPKDLVNEKKEGYLPYLTTDYLRTGIPSNYAKPGNNVILVDNNDILLLWDGSNAGEFFLGRKGILASTMVKLQPKVSNVNKLFYYYYLKQTESHLKSHSKGTGIPHVDKSVLENLLLPMPSLEEQWGIAEVLSTVDRAIELHYEKKVRLECLKRGLMDLLLTGRVRVRVKPAS